MNAKTSPNDMCDPRSGIIGRREFLKLSGAALVVLNLPPRLRVAGRPQSLIARRADYDRRLIASLRSVRTGEPQRFRYPWDDPASTNFLVRLQEPAAGGVGPDNRVVAFNSFCTHQGGPLDGQFRDRIGVAGPCPLHLTTFDLSRHGMVISGHATLGLPQIVLELEGDDIYAVGVQGLIYGYHDNHVDPTGGAT